MTNPDCEYGLSCVGGYCASPKKAGEVCASITPRLNMDNNECDYTQNYICGTTDPNAVSGYVCIKRYSLSTGTYASNYHLC